MTKIIIPDSWNGRPIGGSLDRMLNRQESSAEPDPVPQSQAVTPANNHINDKSNYLILPSKTHGTYSYPDSLVAMERDHFNENWNTAWASLKRDGAYMLTIRQFADFLQLLRSGHAFDGNGSQISSAKLDEIYNSVTELTDPWRSEWLDARFDNQQIVPKTRVGGIALPFTGKSSMVINYHVLDAKGVLTEISEPLEPYLASNKTPGISLDDWLAGATNQGLPKSDTPDGKLYYWAPTNGRVAGFYAYSGRAGLGCSVVPSVRYSWLGVRPARLKI